MVKRHLLNDQMNRNRKQKRRMKGHVKRVTAFVMAGLLASSGIILPAGSSVYAADTDAQILAFQGAEGGGRYATGGRGYDVYIVTNLEDYARNEEPIEGSLRYGLEQVSQTNGGTIIVFNVGGIIALKQKLIINGKNITIAGQTAPGDGITLSGYDTDISDSENLIIRYVRFRPGAANVHTGGDSMDALWGRDNKTFIIDHCSFSWNTDETVSTYRGQDGTVQWCIISESLTVSGHSKGRHGYGGIFGGENVVFQYNLIANHTSRNPRIGGGWMDDPTKDGGSTATLQLSNNVIYNWGYNTCYGGGYAYTNFINNFLKAGIGTRDTVENQVIDMGEKSKPGGFYVSGNYLDGNATVSADNSLGAKMSGETSGSNKTEVATTPYQREGFDHITLVSAEEAYEKVLGQAGATYPYRDAVDARVVAETKNDMGRYVNTEDEVGGYPVKESHRADDFDTDMDGIPDAWESAHGLDPNDATDSKKINPNTGYAYVEEYFNGLVEVVGQSDYVAPNPDVTIDLQDNAQYDEGQAVTVTATATANNGGSIAKVEFYNGTTLVGTDDTAPYQCTYTGLTDGTYNITVRAYDNDGNQTQSSVSKLHINSTNAAGAWTSTDIGEPGIAGSASMTDGMLTVKGAGKLGKSEGSVSGGSWSDATTDNFQYTYMKVTGDTEIITKLDSATAVDNHVFTGVMFRESLDTGAKTAALGMSLVKISSETTWSTYLASRTTTNGSMSNIAETIDSPESAEKAGIPLISNIHFKTGAEYNGTWFKLVRQGNIFTGYSSEDGTTWTKVGSKTIEMSEEIYVGFAVDANKVANDLNNLTTAKFSNIQVNQDFADVKYELTNLVAAGAASAVANCDFSTELDTAKGYLLPESIQVLVDDKELTAEEYTYDAETGKIDIPAAQITSSLVTIVIRAEGVEQGEIQYKLGIYGDTKDVMVNQTETAININQTAESSAMVSKKGTAGKNVSYLLFPESDDIAKMTLKLTVNSFMNGKNSGAYVGVFQTKGDYLFNSISFRGTGDANAVSAYWVKKTTDASKDGSAGNGSPKMAWAEGTSYLVTLEKKADGYYATVKQEGSTAAAGTKTFKSSEAYLTTDLSAQFGIAIHSTDVTVEDLVLADANGTVLYDQNSTDDNTVDFTKLDAAIEAAEKLTASDYKDFTAVEEALTAAKAVNRETAMQVEVDILAKNINSAIAALENADPIETADFTKLDAAVAAAEELTASDYKDFTAVEQALTAAKAVNRETATQAEVDTLTANLNDAVATLEKVEIVEKKNGFVTEDGKKYWYEEDVKQGTEGRGKEIYDPDTDAWYWLDAVQGGAVATGKDVYQESNGGKWVRYDENGHMIKGWQTTEAGTYYFDPITGAMTKGEVTIDGTAYRFNEISGTLLNLEFYTDENGNRFWYENGIRQGTEGRGKEIYDPDTDAWYWLDAVDNGKVATSKDVYQESWAGQFADREDGTGKWVRYDENGHMIKGWNQQNGNTYYFDMVTGAMAKGNAEIEGVWYTFDLYTGILQ